MTSRLAGKTVLITGAAGGIGQAVVAEFLKEGADVVASDLESTDLARLLEDWRQVGPRAEAVAADLADDSDVDRLINSTVESFGSLTTVVSVAGIDVTGSVGTATSAEWGHVLDINLVGMARLVRSALPHVIAKAGSFTFISSIQGLVGWPNWAAYAASKGGLHALTRQMCVEYGADGLRVNSIAPGAILTPMMDRLIATSADASAMKSAIAAMAPLNRIGRPADVAHAAVFLASDEASFISGHILVVDGGCVAAGQPLNALA